MVNRCFFPAATTAAVVALLASACASEPAVHCTIETGDISVQFYPVSGTGACSTLAGDVFGVSAYVVNPENPGDGLSSLAIQSLTLGTLRQNAEMAMPPVVDTNPNDFAYAIGKFSSVLPDPNGVCTVPQLAPAMMTLGAVPAQTLADGTMITAQDATTIKYEWSNIRILVTAAQIGLQMEGDVTFTQDGCTAKYHAVGLYPSLSCNGNTDGGTPVPDSTQCTPDNGINPNVTATCDPDLLLCVPSQEQPF